MGRIRLNSKYEFLELAHGKANSPFCKYKLINQKIETSQQLNNEFSEVAYPLQRTDFSDTSSLAGDVATMIASITDVGLLQAASLRLIGICQVGWRSHFEI